MDFTKVCDNLTSHGFKVSCFETAKEAAEYLDGQVDGKTVGFGGSVTLQEMGLCEMLSKHNTVYWHWLSGMTADEARKMAAGAEIYMLSANGFSENGEIVNIDFASNRVSASLYGHEKVYFIIGKNKLAPDFDSALFRARNIAAPKNAQRLKRNTPCAAKADKCYDCKSPDRICSSLVVLMHKPGNGEYEVVLIDEELGY